ncbi:MAG: hypothetical protein H6719_11970 [Sandaracinaceae bacterium]|nr:hypothetical protein [Sandaracinaceae bacterium]
MRVGIALAALGLAALASPARADDRATPGEEAWHTSGLEGIRGATIGPIESSLFPGRGYGTPATAALLDHLAQLGVNWVSVTPFGRIWSLSSTDIAMDFEAPYDDNRDGIRRLVEQAHERGIQVLLIPHLWVETEGWRGEMDPGSPEGWAAYQASYRAFVTAWARDAAAAGADAFSIGVECGSWSGRFGEYWRALIAEVRSIFDGVLTYSANWDEVENVLFWDELDLIGINAFYPLADHDDASFSEYVQGAMRARQTLAEQVAILEKPVLFTEIGYTTRRNAAVQPWLWPDGMDGVEISEREQARAILASFRAFLPQRWFVGFFVWRWYADVDDVSQEAIWGFSPEGKLAERVLERVFAEPWAVDPEPWAWVTEPPAGPSVYDVVTDLQMRLRSTVVPR